MIVPICPICGYEMYLAGVVPLANYPLQMKRYACVHCNHVEDMICRESEDQEFVG